MSSTLIDFHFIIAKTPEKKEKVEKNFTKSHKFSFSFPSPTLNMNDMTNFDSLIILDVNQECIFYHHNDDDDGSWCKIICNKTSPLIFSNKGHKSTKKNFIIFFQEFHELPSCLRFSSEFCHELSSSLYCVVEFCSSSISTSFIHLVFCLPSMFWLKISFFFFGWNEEIFSIRNWVDGDLWKKTIHKLQLKDEEKNFADPIIIDEKTDESWMSLQLKLSACYFI